MTQATSGPRIPPREVSDWDEEVRDAWEAVSPGSSSRPPSEANIIGIYAWHPDLIRGWMPLSNHLRSSTLPERARELVILRTSWIRDGEYEWAQHRRLGRQAGLSDDDIARVREGSSASGWAPSDALLLRAVDELCHDRMISDDTWDGLSAHLDRRQLMDLLFTIGIYDMHCAVFNSFGLALDPDLEGFEH